jgi:tetratricopeptide (TPR) repeat protein
VGIPFAGLFDMFFRCFLVVGDPALRLALPYFQEWTDGEIRVDWINFAPLILIANDNSLVQPPTMAELSRKVSSAVPSTMADRIKAEFPKGTFAANDWDEASYYNHVAQASTKWAEGNREAAVAQLEEALAKRPSDAKAWYLLGKWTDSLSAPELLTNGRKPDQEKAIYALGQATLLDPTNAAAFSLLPMPCDPLTFGERYMRARKRLHWTRSMQLKRRT